MITFVKKDLCIGNEDLRSVDVTNPRATVIKIRLYHQRLYLEPSVIPRPLGYFSNYISPKGMNGSLQQPFLTCAGCNEVQFIENIFDLNKNLSEPPCAHLSPGFKWIIPPNSCHNLNLNIAATLDTAEHNWTQ